MEVTMTITEGDKTWTTTALVHCVPEVLAACRDTMLAAGFMIGEVAADNDVGDVFWSDDE